jgi:fatty acid hydroxylase family protein
MPSHASAKASREAATSTAERDPSLPSAARRFIRAEHLAPTYTAGRHIGLTVTIAAAISALGIALARRARPVDWVLAPIFLVIANFIEWAIHKHPMHRPLPPRFMYFNHAQLHHMAFTDRDMPVAKTAELGLVMMPWYTMLGVFAVASPVMILAGFARGPGLAGVFLLTAVVYFLMYETLHALYHLPDAALDRIGIGKIPMFRRRQAHHAHHHVLGRMAHVNFNVTFPWMDHLFGTSEKP